MKEYHDKCTNAKERTFNIGDTVLVNNKRKTSCLQDSTPIFTP